MKEGVRCDRKSNRAKAFAMKDGVSYENGIIFRVCRSHKFLEKVFSRELKTKVWGFRLILIHGGVSGWKNCF